MNLQSQVESLDIPRFRLPRTEACTPRGLAIRLGLTLAQTSLRTITRTAGACANLRMIMRRGQAGPLIGPARAGFAGRGEIQDGLQPPSGQGARPAPPAAGAADEARPPAP